MAAAGSSRGPNRAEVPGVETKTQGLLECGDTRPGVLEHGSDVETLEVRRLRRSKHFISERLGRRRRQEGLWPPGGRTPLV